MSASPNAAPSLLRLLAVHLAVGVGVGWSVLAVVCALDTFGLRTLILASSDGVLAAVLLAFFFALTFGSLGMGFGVMTPSKDKPSAPRGRLKPTLSPLTPARVRVRPSGRV